MGNTFALCGKIDETEDIQLQRARGFNVLVAANPTNKQSQNSSSLSRTGTTLSHMSTLTRFGRHNETKEKKVML